MGNKLIVPIAFAVLVIGACVAIYLMLQTGGPGTRTDIADNTPGSNTPRDDSQPLNMLDFDVSRLEPDPVRSERPLQPYTAIKTSTRVVVSGRVMDETGAPVADARVQFTGALGLQGLKGTGYTDQGGNYRVLAWAETLVLKGDPMGRVSAEAADGRVAISENVGLADGAYAEMPDLTLIAVATLEGQVLTATGEPAAGAEVTARSAGPVPSVTFDGREPTSVRRQYVATVVADQTGRYRFANLPHARYQLSAEAYYYGVSAGKPEADVSAAAYAWQDVQLENVKQVRGKLTDAAGNAIPGAVVKLSFVQRDTTAESPPPAANTGTFEVLDKLRDREAGFRDDATLRANVFGDRRALTDAAGRFGFSRLNDGDYKLETKLGDAEAVLDGVKHSQGDYSLQIEATTIITGLVRDAQSGLAVEFFDARAAAGGETMATPFDKVAADGRFEYHPAGAYTIVNPWLEATMVRISAPGYMPACVAIGDLMAGDAKRNVDVSLKPLCELSFDITSNGRRLDFEPVALLFDERLAFEASSDQLGRVRIPRVAPAKYRVKVTLADGTQLEAELDVPATRQAALEAKLGPAK